MTNDAGQNDSFSDQTFGSLESLIEASREIIATSRKVSSSRDNVTLPKTQNSAASD